jgi:hypothetical protein
VKKKKKDSLAKIAKPAKVRNSIFRILLGALGDLGESHSGSGKT